SHFPSATVGVENGTGTEGIQATYNGSGPLEPQSEVGLRYYYVESPTPDISINLTPYNPPIQIPASGGSFDFNIAVTNNEVTPQTFIVWTYIIKPNGGIYGPVIGPINLTLQPGVTAERDRNQNIPGWAPAGMYSYNGYVGVYPDTVYDYDAFEFEKLTVGDGEWITDWASTGEPFDDWLTMFESPVIPNAYSLGQNFPNPFNPSTTISYQLPANSLVNLKVYDTAGRLVATLVNGWREAGTHEVTFDGAKLASGVYLYLLEAGDITVSGKLVLLK
ncbi:MAG: T9SS type A sorting domain-containing protein, partial [bacterium]